MIHSTYIYWVSIWPEIRYNWNILHETWCLLSDSPGNHLRYSWLGSTFFLWATKAHWTSHLSNSVVNIHFCNCSFWIFLRTVAIFLWLSTERAAPSKMFVLWLAQNTNFETMKKGMNLFRDEGPEVRKLPRNCCSYAYEKLLEPDLRKWVWHLGGKDRLRSSSKAGLKTWKPVASGKGVREQI